jgi:hypothetical protein
LSHQSPDGGSIPKNRAFVNVNLRWKGRISLRCARNTGVRALERAVGPSGTAGIA